MKKLFNEITARLNFAEKVFYTVMLSITGGAAMYFAGHLIHVSRDREIQVVKKMTHIKQGNTSYLVEASNNRIYELGLSVFRKGTENVLAFEKIKEGSCYKVDIQGFESNPVQNQYLTKLEEVECLESLK